MQGSLWQQCLARLESELPEQQFNTWIRPLHAIENDNGLKLLAPNRFVLDWVNDHYIDNIQNTVNHCSQTMRWHVVLEIGSRGKRLNRNAKLQRSRCGRTAERRS